MINKREALRDIISVEKMSVQGRILSEYDMYEMYCRLHTNATAEDYVRYRLKGTYTYSQKVNKVFNLRELFDYLGEDIECYLENIEEPDYSDVYCTLDYLENLSIAPEDKLILLFYFLDLQGSKDYYLRHLKYEDIDLDNRRIILDGEEVIFDDDRVFDLLSEIVQGLHDNGSPYVFISNPKKGGHYTYVLTYNAICTKARNINRVINKSFSRTTLRYSGIIYKLLKEHPDAYTWSKNKICIWIELNCGCSVNSMDLHNVIKVVVGNNPNPGN